MKGKKVITLLLAASMALQAVGCKSVEKGDRLVQENEASDIEKTSQESSKTDETSQSGNKTETGQSSSITGASSESSKTGNLQESEKEGGALDTVDTNRIIGIYEAEDGQLTGNVKVAGSADNRYVSGFQSDNDGCSFTVDVDEDGFYDFIFVSASEGGNKENYVSVDGESLGTISVESTKFTDSVISRIYLTQGTHEVAVTKYWGWIKLDKLIVQASQPVDERIYQVSAELVNRNATDETKRLMCYLADIYGKKVLSGQYCDQGQSGKEMTVINKVTGKYPAILGLDFMEYSPSRVANGSTGNATELAVEYWENGGIVTFCWHWNAPEKYLKDIWWKGFYTEAVDIDLAKIMNGEDEEGYDLLMADIDAIAQQLLILQEAKVPVLWRPLHEAGGGWFWWGASGPEAYKQLYILLYDKLTNEYGLNNLIWVWNGQDKDWYPGDTYVDIIGEDIYPGERVYSSQVNKYLEAVNYTADTKMTVLSENGCVPDPDLLKRDGAMWGFFCTWGGEFVANDTSDLTLSEQYTEESMLKKAYDSEVVVTLDELPDLKNYPIR